MTRASVSQLHPASGPLIIAHPDQRIPQYLWHATLLVALLFGGLGGWLATASINGAVVGQATVAAQTKTNVIQHPEGGVVAELFVKEGDLVSAGQRLVRLDGKELDEQLRGTEAELAAKTTQYNLIGKELEGLRDLEERGLVPKTRVMSMQRDMASISGDIGRLTAEKARLAQRVKRLDIRSPLAGRILNLDLHTIGGVISPGKEIMQIVPYGDGLVLEAKLAPKDIDQVRPGQPVAIRLSYLSQRTTPQLSGTVVVVSPDLVRDEAHNTQYYTARVAFDPGELGRLHGVQLVPGMPAEVLIQTDARSALSYLVKPMVDRFVGAFRER
jgi:HlyD family secretion protein